MKIKQQLYLTVYQSVIFLYLLISTAIFYLSLMQGTEGVSVQLFGGGDDGNLYWEQANNVANGQEAIITSVYTVIIGYILKITGFETVYVIRIFNYIGFLMLVLFSLKLIKIIFKYGNPGINQKYILDSKILILIGFLLYASLQMNVNLSIYRDVWIYMLYVFSLLLSIKLIFQRKNRFIYLILLVLSLWLLSGFRKYALLSFIIGLILYYIIKVLKRFKISVIVIGLLLVVLFGVYYTFCYNVQLPIVNLSLHNALNYRMSFITEYAGGSQMMINLDQPNYLLFLLNYIHSYLGNLIGPLPWHISGLSTLIVFLCEAIPMICILYFLWKKRKLISRVEGYILLHAFVWVSLIAVTNDNIGAGTRLRAITWILILIVFVCVYTNNKGFEKLKSNTKKYNED